LIDRGDEAAGPIVRANVRLAAAEALSDTCAVKLKLPAALGVPLMEPSAPIESPAGAVPDHRYGGVPPEAERLCP